MNSTDRGLVVVAEQQRLSCGYAYASYEWRAEFCGETMDIVALFVLGNGGEKVSAAA